MAVGRSLVNNTQDLLHIVLLNSANGMLHGTALSKTDVTLGMQMNSVLP